MNESKKPILFIFRNGRSTYEEEEEKLKGTKEMCRMQRERD